MINRDEKLSMNFATAAERRLSQFKAKEHKNTAWACAKVSYLMRTSSTPQRAQGTAAEAAGQFSAQGVASHAEDGGGGKADGPAEITLTVRLSDRMTDQPQ